MAKQLAGGRFPYLVMVSAVFVWGLLGIADMPNVTYTGYQTTAQSVIARVDAGSPAEAAGLLAGDRIRSHDGIPVEDVRALTLAPRKLPGDREAIGVDRDGRAMTVTLTHASAAGGELAARWVAAIIGLILLFVPFLASSRTWATSGRYLAWFGACFALSFLPNPWFSSVSVRNVASALQLTAVVLAFALLLRFVLAFPQDAPAASKPSTRLLVWAPAALIALLFVYLFLGQPDATSGLNAAVNLLIGLFVIGYFGGALVVLLRKYMAAGAEERADSGLSLVVWGAVIGIVPPLLAIVINLVAPMVVLPGQQYYFLSLGIIPIAFSVAVMRTAPAMATAPAG